MPIKKALIKLYNQLINKKKLRERCTDMKELNEIRRHALKRTDISDHLETMFLEALQQKPRLIVELGVRSGESTFALERAARLCKSTLVSVDIEQTSYRSSFRDWFFVCKDDIAFAQEFPQWCAQRNLPSKVDLLFIDTSHLYEHTCKEIESWFPLLSPQAKVIFHDTNLKKYYKRKDGTIGFGWDNQRGVIRAIEDFLGKTYDEAREFADIRNGWLIRHVPHCNGLTILTSLGLDSESPS